MKIYRDFLQGSDQWWEARRGRPTASSFDKILTPARGEPSSAQNTYICELIAETVQLNPKFFTERGQLRNKISTPEIDHGIECEQDARQWYADETGQPIESVGFCESDCKRYGGSPDGLVIDHPRGLEIKCPQPAKHAEYIMAGELPREYKCQVHAHLIISGFPSWDFVSYCPGFPKQLIVTVTPDDFTVKLKAELEKFLFKLEAAKARLLGNGGTT